MKRKYEVELRLANDYQCLFRFNFRMDLLVFCVGFTMYIYTTSVLLSTCTYSLLLYHDNSSGSSSSSGSSDDMCVTDRGIKNKDVCLWILSLDLGTASDLRCTRRVS